MGAKQGRGEKSDKPEECDEEMDREEIAYLLENTHFTEEEIKQWFNGFMTDYPRGALDKKEFTEIYKEFYTHGKGDKFCKYVFKAFDKDGDGEIDFEEFMVAISVISHGDIRKKLEITFDIYDINKNGKIDKKEITKLIEEIYDLTGETNRDGENSPVEKMKVIMAQLDKNHDGEISRDEFIDGCMNDQALRQLLAPTIVTPSKVFKEA